MSRFKILTVALLTALGVLATSIPAHASLIAPAPTRRGTPMRIVTPGNHYLGVTTIYGAPARMYVYAGRVVLRSRTYAKATSTTRALTSLTVATSCWMVHNEYWYGFTSAKAGSFNQDVYWCGNGTTISSQNQRLYAWLNVYEKLTGGLVYEGVTEKTPTMFYNNWAWQEYAQAKFATCPILHFACFAARYPRLSTNVYANGHYDLWWHS